MSEETAAACLRATGFLELGMPEDALAELDELPSGQQTAPPAQHLRVEILFRLRQWQEAAEIAVPMTRVDPGEPAWWIQAAFAVRRARSVADAEPLLREALAHHPAHGLIHYNLACYACIQGREDEARELLQKAAAEDPASYLGMAMHDPDLTPIRAWIIEQSLLREKSKGE